MKTEYLFDSYLPSGNSCLWMRDSATNRTFFAAQPNYENWIRRPSFGEVLTVERIDGGVVAIYSGNELIYSNPAK